MAGVTKFSPPDRECAKANLDQCEHFPLKANNKRIAAYHASLAEFARLGVKHDTAVRAAFQALLEDSIFAAVSST